MFKWIQKSDKIVDNHDKSISYDNFIKHPLISSILYILGNNYELEVPQDVIITNEVNKEVNKLSNSIELNKENNNVLFNEINNEENTESANWRFFVNITPNQDYYKK